MKTIIKRWGGWGASLFLCASITASADCWFRPPGGAYGYGLHRVAVSQNFANTPTLEQVVWLDDGRVAAGYTGYSSFYPKRGVIRVFDSVTTRVRIDHAIEPPESAYVFSGFARTIASSGNWIASTFTVTNETGAVAVYENTSFDNWTLRATLQADEPEPDDEFGAALAMAGSWLAIVDYGEFTGEGGIYMFHKNDEGTWQRHSILDLPGYSGRLPIRNLAVDMDEDLLVIGQRSSGSAGFTGLVHIWRRDGDLWNFKHSLSPPDGASGDRFGFAVDLSGDLLFVGATQHDAAGTDRGAVYQFRQSNQDWAFEHKLTIPESETGSLLGQDVTFSANGGYLGVTAYAGFHLFQWSGTEWVWLHKNGGGNAFYQWESPAGTVKNYIYGKTNSTPEFPTQRGHQTIVRFGGEIALLEFGYHAVTTKHVTNSLSDCVFEPTGYAANGPGATGSGDQDEDGKSDAEETYFGTFQDASNLLHSGLTPAKSLETLTVQWPRSMAPNTIIDAEPEWSSDLASWTSDGINVQKVGEEPDTGREIMEATIPDSPTGVAFFRLKFYVPPE